MGEFGEVVIIVIAASRQEAYGVSTWEQVQANLYRLEEKGFWPLSWQEPPSKVAVEKTLLYAHSSRGTCPPGV